MEGEREGKEEVRKNERGGEKGGKSVPLALILQFDHWVWLISYLLLMSFVGKSSTQIQVSTDY